MAIFSTIVLSQVHGRSCEQCRQALPYVGADGCLLAPDPWPAALPSSCHDLFSLTQLAAWPISFLKNYFITFTECSFSSSA